MSAAEIIKGLRQGTGMKRKEFSEHLGIPLRTIDDWENGRRKPPEYIPRLIAYTLKYEALLKRIEEYDKLSEYVNDMLENGD